MYVRLPPSLQLKCFMHVNKATFCNENGQRKGLIGEKKVYITAWQTYDDDWCFHKHPSRRPISGHIVCIVQVHAE